MQLLIGLLILGLDQWSKYQLFDQATLNPGIGTGLLTDQPIIALMLVALASIGVVSWIVRSWPRLSIGSRLGATFVSAGLVSNLIDRIRFGAVIDPLSVGAWFPAFNLADCAIVVGLIVMLLTMQEDKKKAA